MRINLTQQLESYTWQHGTVWEKQPSSFPVSKTLHWSLQLESSSGFRVFWLGNAQNTALRGTALTWAMFMLHFRILKWEQLFTKHEMYRSWYTLEQLCKSAGLRSGWWVPRARMEESVILKVLILGGTDRDWGQVKRRESKVPALGGLQSHTET